MNNKIYEVIFLVFSFSFFLTMILKGAHLLHVGIKNIFSRHLREILGILDRGLKRDGDVIEGIDVVDYRLAACDILNGARLSAVLF